MDDSAPTNELIGYRRHAKISPQSSATARPPRKHNHGMSASIFAARKLADLDRASHTSRFVSAIDEAIGKAEKLLKEIECRMQKESSQLSSPPQLHPQSVCDTVALRT